MKPMRMVAVLVLYLLFSQPGGLSFSHQGAQEQPQSLSWTKLDKGVQVLRLWETALGPKKPEIAILRLSDEMYKKFQLAPQAFIEEHKIFPFKLLRVVHCRIPPPETKAPGSKGDDWAVLLYHRPDTSIVSLSQPATF